MILDLTVKTQCWDVLKKGEYDPFFRDMIALPLFSGKKFEYERKKCIPSDDKDSVVKL